MVAKKFKAHSDEMLKTAKIDPPLTAAVAGRRAAGAGSGGRAGTRARPAN